MTGKASTYALLAAYACVTMVPQFGSLDRIGSTWAYICLLNGITLTSALLSFDGRERILRMMRHPMLLAGLVLLIWTACSAVWAINPVETLVSWSQLANQGLTLICVSYLVGRSPDRRRLAILVSIAMAVELAAVIAEGVLMVSRQGTFVTKELTGMGANRNMATFALVSKIPFAVYLMNRQRGWMLTAWSAGLCLLYLTITLMGSRAGMIAVIAITLAYLVMILARGEPETPRKTRLPLMAGIIAPILVAAGLNSALAPLLPADSVVLSRLASTAAVDDDQSLYQRVYYLEDAWEQIQEAPWTGIGFGNWKIVSIAFRKLTTTTFTIPYQVHNDVVQTGAEAGVPGLLLLLSVIGIAGWRLLKLFRESGLWEDRLFHAGLILTALVFLWNMMVNAPWLRADESATLWLALGWMVARDAGRPPVKSPVILVLLPLWVLLCAISFLNARSLSLQTQLQLDLMDGTFSITGDEIQRRLPLIPNLGIYSLPIDAFKARAYLEERRFDEALEMADAAERAHPAIGYPALLLSKAHLARGDTDRAADAAKRAFEAMPGFRLFSHHHIDMMALTRNLPALTAHRPWLDAFGYPDSWLRYVSALQRLEAPWEQRQEAIGAALELHPDDPDLNILLAQMLNREAWASLDRVVRTAREQFAAGSYEEALDGFLTAIRLDPGNPGHVEDAAVCLIRLKRADDALSMLDRLGGSTYLLHSPSARSLYLKGVVYFMLNQLSDACSLLIQSLDLGYDGDKSWVASICDDQV